MSDGLIVAANCAISIQIGPDVAAEGEPQDEDAPGDRAHHRRRRQLEVELHHEEHEEHVGQEEAADEAEHALGDVVLEGAVAPQPVEKPPAPAVFGKRTAASHPEAAVEAAVAAPLAQSQAGLLVVEEFDGVGLFLGEVRPEAADAQGFAEDPKMSHLTANCHVGLPREPQLYRRSVSRQNKQIKMWAKNGST
jgi:hypothetical protein